jgi:hypothetical protein
MRSRAIPNIFLHVALQNMAIQIWSVHGHNVKNVCVFIPKYFLAILHRIYKHILRVPHYGGEEHSKPVLILHSLLDTVVPPEASEEWVEVLRREGRPSNIKPTMMSRYGFLRREIFMMYTSVWKDFLIGIFF